MVLTCSYETYDKGLPLENNWQKLILKDTAYSNTNRWDLKLLATKKKNEDTSQKKVYRITTGLLIEDSKVHQVKDINNNPLHFVFPLLPFYQYFHHSGISSSEKDDFFF